MSLWLNTSFHVCFSKWQNTLNLDPSSLSINFRSSGRSLVVIYLETMGQIAWFYFPLCSTAMIEMLHWGTQILEKMQTVKNINATYSTVRDNLFELMSKTFCGTRQSDQACLQKVPLCTFSAGISKPRTIDILVDSNLLKIYYTPDISLGVWHTI